MKRRYALPKVSSTKKRKIARPNSSTHLFTDDYKEVLDICQTEGIKESEALRLIVSDWIRDKKVEALGKDQLEDPIRRVYERVISEQIAPLVESVKTMKSVVERLSRGGGASPDKSQPSASPMPQTLGLLEAIAELRQMLEQTGSDLTESGAAQMEQLEQIHKSQLTLQSIGSETFATGWTITDLIIRYLVEADLRAQNKEPDEVESEVAAERRGLRLEGLKKIAGIEAFFNLPDEFRLAQLVLSSRTFPMSIAAQNPMS
jgi:hypothetical protein